MFEIWVLGKLVDTADDLPTALQLASSMVIEFNGWAQDEQIIIISPQGKRIA